VWKLSNLAKDTNPKDKAKAGQCPGKPRQESPKLNSSSGQGERPPAAGEAASSVA